MKANTIETRTFILSGQLDERLADLYGSENVDAQRSRYISLIDTFEKRFGESADLRIVSAPGRTELGGNHTDHNNGRVLAGSVDPDCLIAVSATTDNRATLYSEGYDKPFVADLATREPVAAERGSTTSLLRGVARGLGDHGFSTGGFNGFMSSRVLPGSGLSSSAAVEVAIGTAFNRLYNQGSIDPVTIARIGQFAENEFFGKPCGLMDQTASAYGGIIAIDFANPATPVIERVSFSFEASGYQLMVVNTGGNHADLTDDYASIPAEMRAVAGKLGVGLLRQTDRAQVILHAASIRSEVGDRAILRALHYFDDNDRVTMQIDALRSNDIERYLSLVRESGASSWQLLQNCFTNKNPQEQGISLGIALTAQFLKDAQPSAARSGPLTHPLGAVRVHGGGFAGTIQAYIPVPLASSYIQAMESVFGSGCVARLSSRSAGAVALL